MTLVNQKYISLADVAKLKAPDGSILPIAEYLERSTPLFRDMEWLESNLPTAHKTALRTQLPSGTWVKYYQGITPTKSKRQTVTFGMGRLRQSAEADYDLLQLDNNMALALMDEASAHIVSMGQTFEEELIYGTGDDPEKITGLTPRYNSISTDRNNIGYNVIPGGGSGADNTSIWLIYWGKKNVHGIYPKGSTAGISKRTWDPDMRTAPDGNGEYLAIKMLFGLDGGIAIPDWRSIVRICNIDYSELADAGESSYDGASLQNLMIRALNRVPQVVRAMGRPSFYCNEAVKTAMDLLQTNKNTMGFHSIKDAEGSEVTAFRNIPVKQADKILNNEALVS